MKKIFLMLVLGLFSLHASNGEVIYKAKCSMCHASKGMMSESQMKSMQEKMQNATKEQKMAMREKMMEKMQKSSMRAPAMPMVSMRLKMKLKSREAFISFVDDYIQNPSKKKGLCMPMAYKKFGTMPPIGKGMSKKERVAVATWLYENYKGSMGTEMCEMKKGMKCGSGKCGAKQSSSKCGSVKIETH